MLPAKSPIEEGLEAMGDEDREEVREQKWARDEGGLLPMG